MLSEREDEKSKLHLQFEKSALNRKQASWEVRAKVINGELDIDDEVSSKLREEDCSDVLGLPLFWVTCLSSHPAINEFITSKDYAALESLTNISCDYSENFSEFTLKFHFSPNDFFDNDILVKKYITFPDKNQRKLTCTEGTAINWKENVNLCMEVITIETGLARSRTSLSKSVSIPSFFHYFDETTAEEESCNEVRDRYQKGAIKISLVEDYYIGHVIRTSIIPEAILWFTGVGTSQEEGHVNVSFVAFFVAREFFYSFLFFLSVL
jgi:nucleosome assembly protein 1-like 1